MKGQVGEECDRRTKEDGSSVPSLTEDEKKKKSEENGASFFFLFLFFLCVCRCDVLVFIDFLLKVRKRGCSPFRTCRSYEHTPVEFFTLQPYFENFLLLLCLK